MTAQLLELHAVTKRYGTGDAEVFALAGANLRIDEGEFIAVMGASGSGKSTCLNVLGGLDRPSTGYYRFRDVDIGALSRDQLSRFRRHYLGFVFQGYNLLARTSALENVELPLVYRGVGRQARRADARRALAEVGLADREGHTPAQLSGGQQQRVAIARAIVSHPSLLLADEPTGNLDSVRKDEIMRLLLALHRSRGITIVMVTHEPEMAAYASRVVTFRDGVVESDRRQQAAS